jgi:hypothetical protein
MSGIYYRLIYFMNDFEHHRAYINSLNDEI